jgi:hypothetical protein
MEKVGILDGHLEYLLAIWNIVWPFGTYILWPFGNLVAIGYIFPRFGTICPVKSGNPAACPLDAD